MCIKAFHNFLALTQTEIGKLSLSTFQSYEHIPSILTARHLQNESEKWSFRFMSKIFHTHNED